MHNADHAAKYIWFKAEDKSRSPYGAFRKCFQVNTLPVKQAVLHIFADTVYSLYINGRFIGFGPVRFDPRFPQYDSYDIAEYIREGVNVIAVLANFHGHKVFKSIPAQAALIAWGQVDTGADIIRLHTGDTPWKCREHQAYSRFTPKMSFALPTQIYYDQARFDEEWIQPGYDDTPWPEAISLSNQQAFGSLTPREIPFMALTPVSPAHLTIRPLLHTEQIYSFYYPLPIGYDTAFDTQKGFSRFLCWATYLYSPRKQLVTAGVLYERLWINGKPCDNKEDAVHPLRYNAVLALEEGWNYLFAYVDVFQDIYEGYLVLPDNRGLILSADKNTGKGSLFRYLPLQPMERDAELHGLTLPLPEDFDMGTYGGWVYTDENDRAASPCREASWDNYAPPVESAAPDDFASFIIKKDLYPDGFTLTYDMAHMRLVFPCLTLHGVRGAHIDLLYSDRYGADQQHLRSLSWVPLGDRIACAQDDLQWMPIQPRGFRYLSITLRNTAGDVRINDIAFLSAHYPVSPKGLFECSDPLLNRIWEMGARTLAINMEDTYDDCVDRERGLYALDVLIQYHVNLACYGDHALMKRALELYGQSIHEIGLFRCLYPNSGDYILTDFCLYVINAFHAYYRQTGDTKLIAQYWPEIMKNLHVFHRLSDERPDKLLCADPPAGNWPRTPEDNRTGFLGDTDKTDHTGINGIFSCLYLLTMRHAKEMAEVVSTDDVPDLTSRINQLAISIPAAFWNEEKGLFADNHTHEHFSPHASLFAVEAGVTSPEQNKRLYENISALFTPFFKNGYDATDGTVFETSHGFYLMEALYKLGLDETAERCIKDGWGYFLVKGLNTTAEHFDLQGSQCHAWTAFPTYMLSRYVLGVRFDAHAEAVTVAPQPGSLTWAKGIFPHPKGLVEVAWHIEKGQIIFDRLAAPEGVEIRLGV